MTHLEFGALRDKLGAIPETCRRLYGHEICDGCHHEAEPSEHIVVKSVSFHRIAVIVEIVLLSVNSLAKLTKPTHLPKFFIKISNFVV